MDPVTAALNVLDRVLSFAEKVWDATPQAEKEAQASNWAKFFLNIGDAVLKIQERLTPK
jgi:hypothetical protein